MDRKKLIKILISLILGIFLVNFLANKFYWYSSIWYFDMIMHTLGSLFLGLSFMYVFPRKDNSFNSLLKILLFVLFIGISWEIYEFIFYEIVARNIFNPLDTFSDLFFDLSGGTMAILYSFKRIVFVDKNDVQLTHV